MDNQIEKFTPGNWELADSIHSVSLWSDSERDEGTVIASIFTENDDAYILAASKDLYFALKGLVEKVELLSLWDKTDQAYYKAKEALAKALPFRKEQPDDIPTELFKGGNPQ